MSNDPNNYKFQKLTPIGNADIKVYREALDFVFDEPNGLRNIAITGAYSAGKSSVIETYKKERSNHKFLHISLAHFEKTNVVKDGNEDGNTIKDSELEGKIINQLIHQIPSEKIPQTQFKVKRRLRSSRLWLGTVIIAALVSFLIFLFNNKKWDTYVGSLKTPWLKSVLKYTTNDVFSFFALLAVISIVSYLIYYVIRIQYNKNVFRKLTVQGNEIEIFSNQDDSYFDKYLNEVLYLFENSDHQVFIFEDMDRFNDNKIFEKLREINTLLNKKSDNVFWFVYLLRDDMFTSKDRTKFFDFLIPIVPVVDGSNSYDQFLDHFKKGELLQHFDINFLQGISLYIDDMRLLKNIYNEYVIYHERIQSTELSPDRLLAMITYKNLFPRDFSELQLNRGFVYTLFISKKTFIEEEIHELEERLLLLQQKISSSEDELVNNLDELDALYLNTDKLDIDGKSESQFPSRRDFLKALKISPDNVYKTTNYRGHYAFEQHYKNLEKNVEYTARKEKVENKIKEANEKLHDEIQYIQNLLRVIKDKKLKEIVSKTNINEIFAVNFTNEVGEDELFIDVKSSPYFLLIKYLIRNGYIDETYPDYMTYFYENSLSRNDKIFLRSITDEIPKDFTYPLKNKCLITSRLKLTDFDQEEILNFDLLDYLLLEKHEYLQRFINQLKEKSRLDFIQQFIGDERENDLFIKEANRAWPLLFKELLNSSFFSEQETKYYALGTLYYSTNYEVRAVNNGGILTSYISNNENFLAIGEINSDFLIKKFKLLNVRFKKIDYGRSNPQLFKEVYVNNLYEINMNMIFNILQNVYGEQNEEDLKHRNFTLITSRPEESLAKYIRGNISTYLDVFLFEGFGKIIDSEDAALEILNHTEIPVEQRRTYLIFLETPIMDIDDLEEKELWDLSINVKKIAYSMHNILRYYFEKGNQWTDDFISFINQDPSPLALNYEDVSSSYGEEKTQLFYESIIKNNNLSDEKYEMLLAGYGHVINVMTYEDLPDTRIDILIKHSIIEMNDENLQFMREHYSDNVLLFILNNIEKYTFEVISEVNFNLAELLILLQNNEIEDKNKIHLLEYTDQPISLQEATYSECVQQYIISNNLNVSDIAFLIRNYELNGVEFKKDILEMCITNIGSIITLASESIIPFSLFVLLIETDQIEEESKFKLLIAALMHLSIKQAQKCFDLLLMHDFIGLFDGKRPKLERSETNQAILEGMKEKGWINSFEIDQREDNYFRAYGKKLI